VFSRVPSHRLPPYDRSTTLVHAPPLPRTSPPQPRDPPWQWGKLAAFGLTQFRRLVALDLDLIIRRNLDHLFSDQIEAPAATAEGVPPARDGSTLAFNTGLLVLDPSRREHTLMMRAKDRLRSYDGSEQGFLVSFFAGREAMPGAPWHMMPSASTAPGSRDPTGSRDPVRGTDPPPSGGRGLVGGAVANGAALGLRRTRWSELPRRYNLFQCTQPDEVDTSWVWHLNPNFHGGFGHPTVRRVLGALDGRIDSLLRGSPCSPARFRSCL